MSNDEIYAGGLLTRALDPSTQPPAVQAFLREENHVLQNLVRDGMRVIDIGCGNGRHLVLLGTRLSLGVGVDYQRSYIADAVRRASAGPLHFLVADGTAVPTTLTFDLAICLTNTWGTMSDKQAILGEMRRLAPRPLTRVFTVFSEASVPARRAWYAKLGHEITEITDKAICTTAGFRSEHFTEARLRDLVGDCVVRPVAEIGYLVTV